MCQCNRFLLAPVLWLAVVWGVPRLSWGDEPLQAELHLLTKMAEVAAPIEVHAEATGSGRRLQGRAARAVSRAERSVSR